MPEAGPTPRTSNSTGVLTGMSSSSGFMLNSWLKLVVVILMLFNACLL